MSAIMLPRLFLLLGVMVMGMCSMGRAQDVPAETATVCDIYQNAAKYKARVVRVEARYYGGLHGEEIVDDECRKLRLKGKVIPPGIDLALPGTNEPGETPVEFTLNRESWASFTKYLKTVDRNVAVFVTLVGQIRVKDGYELENFGGGLAGNGYGVRGIYRIQLVVRSVEAFRTSK